MRPSSQAGPSAITSAFSELSFSNDSHSCPHLLSLLYWIAHSSINVFQYFSYLQSENFPWHHILFHYWPTFLLCKCFWKLSAQYSSFSCPLSVWHFSNQTFILNILLSHLTHQGHQRSPFSYSVNICYVPGTFLNSSNSCIAIFGAGDLSALIDFSRCWFIFLCLW